MDLKYKTDGEEIAALMAKTEFLNVLANDLRKERDAALKECEEEARLNGMGAQREARLITERDAAVLALQAVEWFDDRCPWCKALCCDDHEKGCQRQKALGK